MTGMDRMSKASKTRLAGNDPEDAIREQGPNDLISHATGPQLQIKAKIDSKTYRKKSIKRQSVANSHHVEQTKCAGFCSGKGTATSGRVGLRGNQDSSHFAPGTLGNRGVGLPIHAH